MPEEESMSLGGSVGLFDLNQDGEAEMTVSGIFGKGYKTQSAGTVITEIVPGNSLYKTRVVSLIYRVGTTAHTLTLMRPVGDTTTTSAAATGQAVINVATASPAKTAAGALETLAAADYLAWKDTDGTWQYDIISSVSSNAITMTSNVPSAISAGATIWAFYEVGRAAHIQFNPGASTTRTLYPNFQTGITKQVNEYNIRSGVGDPVLFHSDNSTAAGFLENIAGTYVDSSQFTMT